jgi:hypothetical protein
MADDKTLRNYRSNDPHRREPSAAGGHGDPLAELARLIGQNDPFQDLGRNAPRGDAREPQRNAPPPVSDWRREAAAMPAYETFPEETVRRQPARSEPQYGSNEPEFPREHEAPRYDPYQMASDPYVSNDPQGDMRSDEMQHRHQFADADQPRGRRDDHMYRAQPPQSDEHYFEDGAPLPPHDEQSYDDPPRARRHGGLLTAITLIGCAMIGTAGAYGYRTYYVAPGGSKTPPTITADTTPSKVVSADTQAGKSIQDRVGELGQNERMVSREEQPVEIKTPTATAPRVVLPAPVAPQGPSGASIMPPAPTTTPPAAAQAPLGPNEPKRIRTVTIRADGTDLSGRPVGGLNQQASGQGANGQGATGPAPVRTTAPAVRTAPARSNGPLLLDPNATASTPAEPAPQTSRERLAAVPPTTPPAPRLASTSASGGYVVQLSSQRSEADAQSSFRSLQAKFPNQLSGRSPIVRRADLGDKGIYYRAMVGPFASSDEAAKFCSGLKAAGGQCLIQRN